MTVISVLKKEIVLHYVLILCSVSRLQGNWNSFRVAITQIVVHAKITEIENCILYCTLTGKLSCCWWGLLLLLLLTTTAITMIIMLRITYVC